MSEKSFERKIEEGFYITGHERDQLLAERRKLVRQLRYVRHSARLTTLSKRYDFAMVFFAAMGTIPLVLFDAKGASNGWLVPVLGFSLMLFACRNAVRGRKVVNRIKTFDHRFSSWRL